VAKKLIAELHNSQAGKPILVIGGGPSVLEDLPHIPGWQDMYIISANAHGFKVPGAKPSLIVCKDHYVKLPLRMRTKEKTYMEPLLRQYGVPIASKQHWADYRMAAWRAHGGNSGMLALAVAVCLGGWPVISTGIDGFQGATYFHDPSTDNVSRGHPVDYWNRRFTTFRTPLARSIIRARSGPVARAFGTYRANETYPPFRPCEAFAPYADTPTYLARTTRHFQDPGDRETTIPKDYVFPVTSTEFDKYLRLGLVVAASPPPAPGEGADLRRRKEAGAFRCRA
jgi:hypothetical protein